jgi:hypothetical protein
MNLSEICQKFKVYETIKNSFIQKNKLTKISVSVDNIRYCFKGYIENGILKVFLFKKSVNPNKAAKNGA